MVSDPRSTSEAPTPHDDYTRGLADGLGSAIALLNRLRDQLAPVGDNDRDPQRDLRLNDGSAQPLLPREHLTAHGSSAQVQAPDHGRGQDLGTWIAALAVGISREREWTDGDVADLVILSRNDCVGLQLATARILSTDLDVVVRGRAASLLRRALTVLESTNA